MTSFQCGIIFLPFHMYIFNSNDRDLFHVDNGLIQRAIQVRLSEEQNGQLVKDVIDNKIKAIFSIKQNKVSSPDGFNLRFLKVRGLLFMTWLQEQYNSFLFLEKS